MKINRDESETTPAEAAKTDTAPAEAAAADAEKEKAAAAENTGKKTVTHKKRWIVLAVIAVILLALVGLGYAYFHGKVSLLRRADGSVQSDVEIDSSDAEVQADAEEMEEAVSELEEMESIAATGETMGDDGVFNILFIGTDERSEEFSENARGDTCMLCSLNKETGEVKLVSFERGMGVPILAGAYQGQYDWLTHTFRYGGAELMMQEIRENFKIDVTHYVRVNIYTFMQLVDSVGGVDIELTQDEVDYINNREGYGAGHVREMGVEDQIQTVQVGINHLNGATAMMYARCRWIDSDWRRVERQRNVITAAMKQLKNLNVLELDSLLNNVLPLVETNLTEGDIAGILLKAPTYLNSSLDQMTIPQDGTYGSMIGMGGRSMFSVDFDTNAKILQEFIYGESSTSDSEG